MVLTCFLSLALCVPWSRLRPAERCLRRATTDSARVEIRVDNRTGKEDIFMDDEGFHLVGQGNTVRDMLCKVADVV